MPLVPMRRWAVAAGAAALLTSTLSGGYVATADVPDDAEFYVAKPNHDAKRQIAELTRAKRKDDAALIRSIIDTPTAVWVESGSPKKAEQQVRQITQQAAGKGTIPTLVVYNIPFRDCAQYSSGGATSVAEYTAWIDGVARGIGDREVIIALEPDGLGIIPHYTTMDGNKDWCQPAEADAATAAAERFEMLNYAVDAFKALPQTSVYLDGTHDGWLGVGEAADRLIKAGVTRADGFFLNASNYRWTDRLTKYGEWLSQCIYLDQNSWFQRGWCGSQYYPADPNDFSTWGKTDATYDKAFAETGLARDTSKMPHFIIDTSRNGQGPWDPTQDGFYQDANGAWWYKPTGGAAVQLQGDPQTWCNPPRAGIGPRPTADTGNPLVDAYVWIKVPGESDGQCSRGLGTGDNVVDPIWGQVDPDAGLWFPAQALDLAKRANPPLR